MELDQDTIHFSKKKARRSSFTPGRAKQLQNNLDVTCNIKQSLPADLQLSELAKKCVKCTLNILTNDIPSLEETNICDEVEAAVNAKINEMIDQNIFYNFTHKESCSVNPVGKTLETTIGSYKSLINTYEEESSCWDEMKSKTKKMANDAELQDIKKLKNYEDLPEVILDASAKYLPAIQFDPEKIHKTIDRALIQADISMKYLQTASNILHESARDIHSQVDDLHSSFTKSDFKKLPNLMKATPRRLLKRIIVSNDTVQQKAE